MRRRVTTALIALPLALTGACAGVGSGSGSDEEQGGPGSGSEAYAGTPTGTLSIMGFGGENEVGQSRIKALKDSAPAVTVRQNKGEYHWEIAMAATLVATLPMVLVFALAQRHILDGIATSAQKG